MSEVKPSDGSDENLQKKIHHYGYHVPLTAAQVRFTLSASSMCIYKLIPSKLMCAHDYLKLI